MKCLAEQTCQDFEVLVYHDGPKATSYEDDVAGAPCPSNIRFFVTDERENCWGHSNRDRGIRAATGTWIVHTNADNVFYPTLLERLKAEAECTIPRPAYQRKRLPMIWKSIAKRWDIAFGTNLMGVEEGVITERQILVFAIVMVGIVPILKSGGAKRLNDMTDAYGAVYGGIPVSPGNIDLMQFVMRRELWLKEGGWSNTHENSDGMLYRAFAGKYDVIVVPKVLGEHW